MTADRGAADAVRTAFDRTAHDYDRSRRQLVPCFEDFYGAVLDLLPFEPESRARVLDLGAGTGLLSALIRDRFPQVELTLVDITPKMLDLARKRFADDDAHVAFEIADLETLAFERQYDAVVSALAIHHLADDGKARLFSRVFGALAPGGLFVNAEQVLGETETIDRRYWDTWDREARALGATDADIEDAWMRMAEDRSATLEAQLGWLRDAGFRDVTCWYKWQAMAVYSGAK